MNIEQTCTTCRWNIHLRDYDARYCNNVYSRNWTNYTNPHEACDQWEGKDARHADSKAYNMDCMDAMWRMPDKCFDLAVVDPPYGINAPNMTMGTNKSRKGTGYPGESVAQRLKKGRINSGSGKLKNRSLQTMPITWDDTAPDKEYFEELFRVSKNQVIFGGNYFDLPPTRGIICWDKMQPWDNFSQWEMAWTSFDFPAKIFRYSNTGGRNDEIKIHPTQKPVALYSWIYRLCAKPGDKVLDTHLGSGSSRIAAYNYGLDFAGFEIDKGYFEHKRIDLKRIRHK